MNAVSLIFAVLGTIGMIFALSMDTTVTTDFGARVHNIGLVSDRQTYSLVSGFMLLVSAVLFGFSTLRQSSANQKPSASKLAASVCVLLTGAFVVWYSVGRTSPTAPVESKVSVPRSPTTPDDSLYLPVEPFTVNLAGGGDNFLQIAMVWLLSKNSDRETIQIFNASIRNKILQLLSTKSLDQVSGSENKAKLAEEIRTTVNRTVGEKANVKEVVFTTFVTQ